MRIFSFFILFLLFIIVRSKQFRLGRSKFGNLGSPGGPSVAEKELPEPRWFNQKLDHFNPSDLRTWKQRYYVNASFFDSKKPGPVFLLVGGEGAADPRWLTQGTWIDYAKDFKALCINLEHRYYGQSHPTRNLSVKNMQHLSSAQALADIANFITAMNSEYKFSSEVKWVAFGGSYPGSLAAWLRLKYPHLVYAAVSSSGPLLAKVNFMGKLNKGQEYFQVVLDALREKTGDESCVNELKLAHTQIGMMLTMHPDVIEKEFKVCKPFDHASKNDMKTFYMSLADYFADLVQYNEDNRIGSDHQYHNLTINSVCSMLTESTEELAYVKLAKFNDIMLQKGKESCLDYSYEQLITSMRNETWNDSGERQWMYQTCTEFGFYQTSSSAVEVFGDKFDLPYFIEQCKDVFGNKYNERFIQAGAQWTNSDYGALGLAVTRVVFVHGSVDPWHALGRTTTESEDAPAIYIRGTAHCANMYPARAEDSEQLREARLEVQQYLAGWLSLPPPL